GLVLRDSEDYRRGRFTTMPGQENQRGPPAGHGLARIRFQPVSRYRNATLRVALAQCLERDDLNFAGIVVRSLTNPDSEAFADLIIPIVFELVFHLLLGFGNPFLHSFLGFAISFNCSRLGFSDSFLHFLSADRILWRSDRRHCRKAGSCWRDNRRG